MGGCGFPAISASISKYTTSPSPVICGAMAFLSSSSSPVLLAIDYGEAVPLPPSSPWMVWQVRKSEEIRNVSLRNSFTIKLSYSFSARETSS